MRYRNHRVTAVTALITCIAILATVYLLFLAPNHTVVRAYPEGSLNVVIEGEVVAGLGMPLISHDHILLPLQMISEKIDPDISWDKEVHLLTVTTDSHVIRMRPGSLTASADLQAVSLEQPLVESRGEILVPIEFLSSWYNITISLQQENSVILIDFLNKPHRTATPLNKGAVIRNAPTIRAPIHAETVSGSKLMVVEELEKWVKVRTSAGVVGFIPKNQVRISTEPAETTAEERPKAWVPQNGKLTMAWDYAWNRKAKQNGPEAIPGLDVISPTWFRIANAQGDIDSYATTGYVEQAHKNGYQVWALFCNDFTDPKTSSVFLNDADARDHAIRVILQLAEQYGLEGINLDFENLKSNDKGALAQFVREISPLMRQRGMTISVDVNMQSYYDRKKLAEAADYTVLMAYDQHWQGGGEAGSVSQLSWTEDAVQSFLNSIPKDRFILGMPFYTRLWKETQKDGKTELSSQALSMIAAEALLEQVHAVSAWDEESGQYYSEFQLDGAACRIWQEEERSIGLRTELVRQYDLSGAAAWRLGFEQPEIWDVIRSNLKD